MGDTQLEKIYDANEDVIRQTLAAEGGQKKASFSPLYQPVKKLGCDIKNFLYKLLTFT